MKRLLGLLLCAACGSSGNAALSKNFTYGAPQAPTSTESAAAASAQTSLGDAASFSSSASIDKGVAVFGFADALASAALGDSGLGAVAPRAAANAGQALRSAADFSTCGTISGNTVTFSNCTNDDFGFHMTLNGSITATAGKVSWDISSGFSGSEQNVSFNVGFHQAGGFTVTDTGLNGDATSEASVSASGNGQSASLGVAQAVIVGLTWQTVNQQFCVNSGNVEVKRVWTAKPGQGGDLYKDAGVKINWTACNAPVQVAHST
jgi:hypothetical protein